MSELTVNEITSVDGRSVDFPDGITINGANLGAGAYELTQADIDNATTTSGTVSGEQLASIGGGGGVEVLKDWTTVSTPDLVDLLAGVDFGIAGRNGVEVEIRDLNLDASSLSITSTTGMLAIVPANGSTPNRIYSAYGYVDKYGENNVPTTQFTGGTSFGFGYMYAKSKQAGSNQSARYYMPITTIKLQENSTTTLGVDINTLSYESETPEVQVIFKTGLAILYTVIRSYANGLAWTDDGQKLTRLELSWPAGMLVDYSYRVIRN